METFAGGLRHGTLILNRLTQKDTVNINGKQVEQDRRNCGACLAKMDTDNINDK